MKILVIDDDQVNCDAARAQFADHDVTVVSTYDKGQLLIAGGEDASNGWARVDPVAFDVVLVDLLMPASRQQQGNRGSCFVGKEMPVGIFLGLLAAVKNGAKYVAVFTDSSHHDHPASACFDVFNCGETYPTPFAVEGAQMLLSNTRNWVREFRPDDLATPLAYEDYDKVPDKVRAKNWRRLLDYLLDNSEEG